MEANPHKATLERLMKVLNVLGVQLNFSDVPLIIDTATGEGANNMTAGLSVITPPAKNESGKNMPDKKLLSSGNTPSRLSIKKIAKDEW